MNLISQYKGLRKENYVLCFGRFVTAMGAMVRPMLTMILSQKLGMNALQVAWITALMGILTIPANLIGGKMADRFNKKMNIVYLDMISVISYIICGLIPLTTKSIVLMFIASTCQNMENPSYNSLTADITLSKDRERVFPPVSDSKSRRRDGFCCSRIYVSQLLMACIFAQWNFHRHFFCADLFLCTEYHTGKRRK